MGSFDKKIMKLYEKCPVDFVEKEFDELTEDEKARGIWNDRRR